MNYLFFYIAAYLFAFIWTSCSEKELSGDLVENIINFIYKQQNETEIEELTEAQLNSKIKKWWRTYVYDIIDEELEIDNTLFMPYDIMYFSDTIHEELLFRNDSSVYYGNLANHFNLTKIYLNGLFQNIKHPMPNGFTDRINERMKNLTRRMLIAVQHANKIACMSAKYKALKDNKNLKVYFDTLYEIFDKFERVCISLMKKWLAKQTRNPNNQTISKSKSFDLNLICQNKCPKMSHQLNHEI